MSVFKVLLSGGNQPLTNYTNALSSVRLKYTTSYAQNTDALLLLGGGDVSPCLYGSRNVCSTDVDIERDCKELFLIERYLKQSKPIFGICRGIQILNVALGGTLNQSLKNLNVHSRLNSTIDKLHVVKSNENSICSNVFGELFLTNSAHHQSIDKLATPLKISAKSLDGEIEAVESNKIFAVQFHPERMMTNNKFGLKFFEFMSNSIQSSK